MDFCFHSYFSYMDELSEKVHENEKSMEIQLSMLPSGFLVAILAIPVDVPLITAIALWKSPYMLFRGWKRLLEDLVGREGPFLETVCVPFAGLAIFLWPLAVIGAVLAAFFSSIFLGLYGGAIVIEIGCSVSMKSLFDSTKIVAKGVVRSMDPNTEVGRQALGPNWCEIQVLVVLEREESLIRPYDLFQKVGDTLGGMIAWPCHLVTRILEFV